MRISDWSSDVCSSDLEEYAANQGRVDTIKLLRRGIIGASAGAKVGQRLVEHLRDGGDYVVSDQGAVRQVMVAVFGDHDSHIPSKHLQTLQLLGDRIAVRDKLRADLFGPQYEHEAALGIKRLQ